MGYWNCANSGCELGWGILKEITYPAKCKNCGKVWTESSSDPGGCAVVLIVGALVAGLLGLGGHAVVDRVTTTASSAVR